MPKDLADTDILILDGACGSTIQTMHIPRGAWADHEGCNEYLNLSAGDKIVQMHEAFFDAGAQVVETNTFGATDIVLAEYGLEDQVDRINRLAVAHARSAAADRHGLWVAGSIGPTTKMPSLGHVGFDELFASYVQQVSALVEEGVDLLIVETSQDLLQAKIALQAIHDVLDRSGKQVPLIVSVTVETTNTMLAGADIEAAAVALEPYDIFSLGLNCATGPQRMEPHLKYLSQHWPGRIHCIPNAGMPQVVDGKTCYPLEPEEFGRAVTRYVRELGVRIVGGCCGTTPAHIRSLVEELRGAAQARREGVMPPALSSAYQAQQVVQQIPPLMIGERANTNGSKKFREMILADDYQAALKVLVDQEGAGAHALDLCTAYAGRDEMADLTRMVTLARESVRLPLVIDSTTPDVIEACLKIHPGRCLINSINLEDGGENLGRICGIAARFGAACIALTIHEGGMAMTAAEKLETAGKIHDLAVGKYALRPQDLFFDPLTFTIGSGDESLRSAGMETLEGIRQIKKNLPGVFTVLGLSNISFGLTPASRKVLNSVFLHEAIEAGLDAAIIDVGKILPLNQIPSEQREVALDLIHDRRKSEERTPLMAYIDFFSGREKEHQEGAQDQIETRPPEQILSDKVVNGEKDGLEDALSILLERKPAVSIINDLLVPAMRHVGDLFGRGEMLLPFVLQSAEVMKRSVDYLEPYMDHAETKAGAKVLLATVQGDVHDIGKNLVDIILSNNGYQVHNIGIKVPVETIIEKAREYDVDVIGLSGLLVKSAIVMKESMPRFAQAGLTQPILLGGAALTRQFVAQDCVPDYGPAVVYCADAFAGLQAMRQFEEGTLQATTYCRDEAPAKMKPGLKDVNVRRDNRVPQPPFLGPRHVSDVDVSAVLEYVNKQALFRGRWGYRRAKLSAQEYDRLIADKVEPIYQDLCRRSLSGELIAPRVAYGYWKCYGQGDRLIVCDDQGQETFCFPRQEGPPHLCIADYFKTQEEGGDVVGFFVVTIGEKMSEVTQKLYERDDYHDYLLMHAFGVEVTDALAEYWHEKMREELGINQQKPESIQGYYVQDYQGSRYGFGYPACPDLEAHVPVFRLLKPEAIGVSLTENMQMVPEQTTSAVIAHHPQAKYFAI
jgi:5-methyltetrahydrofolate--homocysteine methyltransferase